MSESGRDGLGLGRVDASIGDTDGDGNTLDDCEGRAAALGDGRDDAAALDVAPALGDGRDDVAALAVAPALGDGMDDVAALDDGEIDVAAGVPETDSNGAREGVIELEGDNELAVHSPYRGWHPVPQCARVVPHQFH